MKKKKMHIPKPGVTAGLQGPALCGRWGHYLTGDHRQIGLDAKSGGDHWCARCLRKLTNKESGGENV